MQDPQKVSQLQRFVYGAPATSSHIQPYFDIFAQLHVSSLCQPLDVTMTTRNAEFKQIGQELRKKQAERRQLTRSLSRWSKNFGVSERAGDSQTLIHGHFSNCENVSAFFGGFLALNAERMFHFGWQTHEPARLGLLEGCYHRLKACFVICCAWNITLQQHPPTSLHHKTPQRVTRVEVEGAPRAMQFLAIRRILSAHNLLDVTHKHVAIPCQMLPDIDITRLTRFDAWIFLPSEFGIVSWYLRRGLNTPRGLWGT